METKGKDAHADMSAKIFSEYAIKRIMKPAFIEKVKKLIKLHLSKELLKETKIPIELILLIESDLLDEEVALRMVWYNSR